ncbi:hypothetical protein [Paraburkholderia phenoliruptrix]|uniref:hypothetical protein n=1 Tax=Paraburkholderia phenoliruptrix TaxID=252970 RepID=UPI003D993065
MTKTIFNTLFPALHIAKGLSVVADAAAAPEQFQSEPDTAVRANAVSKQFKEMLGTFEVDLGVQHFFSDGLYARRMTIPAGYTVGTHALVGNHLGLLAKGRVTVATDTSSADYVAPACIPFAARTNHNIVAHEDAVWYCLHATDCTDPDKIDEVLIQKGD